VQPAPRNGLSLGALALPTFALALGISVLTTYAPLLLGEATSSAARSGSLSALKAPSLPVPSDRLARIGRSRLGRRIPYALIGVPLLVAPLVILPFAHGYAETVALVSLFFIGYHIYYPPYQALFAELVPASHQGRAQGWQGVMRGLGLGVALVAGGLLLTVWTPLPFLLAAGAAVLRHGRARGSESATGSARLVPGRRPARPRRVSGWCASAPTSAPSWPRTPSGSSPSWA
jgi:hypothetical protein